MNIKITKSTQAYSGIRKMVITGEFSGDNAWSMRSLAERFAMSVVPITEAVRRLEQEGILLVRPQTGISVRQLSLQEIEEYTIVREGIEVQAARILTVRGTEQEKSELFCLVSEHTRLLEEESFQAADYQDFLLHKRMVEMTGMRMLVDQFERVATILFLTVDGWNNSVITRSAGWQRSSIKENGRHTELIDAIFNGNRDSAEYAVRKHIKSLASKEG